MATDPDFDFSEELSAIDARFDEDEERQQRLKEDKASFAMQWDRLKHRVVLPALEAAAEQSSSRVELKLHRDDSSASLYATVNGKGARFLTFKGVDSRREVEVSYLLSGGKHYQLSEIDKDFVSDTIKKFLRSIGPSS